jgi:hypothetical protein
MKAWKEKRQKKYGCDPLFIRIPLHANDHMQAMPGGTLSGTIARYFTSLSASPFLQQTDCWLLDCSTLKTDVVLSTETLMWEPQTS